MIKEIIDVIKDHYLIIIGSFFVIRFVELVLRLIVRRLFGVVLFTGKTITKPLKALKRLTLINWLLIGIIIAMVIFNLIMFM